MSITPFQVTLWIELLAAGLGGLQGALFAAGVRSRRIDVLGVIVIGLAVALGEACFATPCSISRRSWSGATGT
jgi:hypothetical protein